MKQKLLFFFLTFNSYLLCFSQNNVGVGTVSPDASAVLDVSATDKGILIPRMGTLQRLAIANPANGLLVYDIDFSCFFYNSGIPTVPNWISMCNGSGGSTGITGPTGANGTNGLNGITGATGLNGTNGLNGVTGATGANGLNGATGPTGATGLTGSAGITGPSGADGVNGINGTDGATGVTGPGTICASAVVNFVSKFTSSTDLCNSLIYDDGTTVAIGTTSPFSGPLLDVRGAIRAEQGAPNNADVSSTGYAFGNNGDSGLFNDSTLGAANSRLSIFVNNVRRVSILSARMGIGVDAPATYRLELPNTNNNLGEAVANAWNNYSDRRLKTNLHPIEYGLKELLKLEPLSYQKHSSTFINGKLILGDAVSDFGFIAQDLNRIIPEATSAPADENSGLWSVDYSKLSPIIIQAIKELNQRIESLERENGKLRENQANYEYFQVELKSLKEILSPNLNNK